ncbi:12084_t:CDS:2 [Entrophospora sp. SA101]|nr:12084_t:CDS:2 [Entrophospora sp. SA101]CAJ0907243.1 19870_t:CDS:2 [Entrophospora sp. SA101]
MHYLHLLSDKRITSFFSSSLSSNSRLEEILHKKFHLEKFHKDQLKVIEETLNGEDVLVLMPTGSGKSLCYQLPAIVENGKTKGITVVISPLLSLIIDQIHNLNSRYNIPALSLYNEQEDNEKQNVYAELNKLKPSHKLFYLTPEMLNRNRKIISIIRGLYEKKQLARFAIDEAHCISKWGHDFRPDYKELCNLKKNYPEIPIIALTATATPKVKNEIINILGIQRCKVIQQGFNRKNLYYEVHEKDSSGDKALEYLVKLVESYKGKSGIIYCITKKDCEKVVQYLQKSEISAKYYHSGVEKAEKIIIQNEWQFGRLQIIAGTTAFGMGIDKPDVRFVIHYSLPRSLEEYYQETGRAGRDGDHAVCVLLYAVNDYKLVKAMIEAEDGIQKEQKRTGLLSMRNYCENTIDCRRKQFLEYFGEIFDTSECEETCDNCSARKHKIHINMENKDSSSSNTIKIVDKKEEQEPDNNETETLIKAENKSNHEINISDNSISSSKTLDDNNTLKKRKEIIDDDSEDKSKRLAKKSKKESDDGNVDTDVF